MESFIKCYLEEDRIDFKKIFDKAVESGRSFKFEGKIRTHGREYKLIRITGETEIDSNGNVNQVIGLVQDVTLESERFNYLQESQQLLEAVSSIANIGHWRLNLADHDLFWSDEVYRIHGYEPGEIRPTLENGINFYHPDDRERITDIIERSLATGEDFSFQARIIRADGEIRQVLSRGLVQTENDINTILFGVFQDISEQSDFEEQRLMWSYLVNESPEAIIITDEKGKVIWVNHSCENLTGYTLEEMKGLQPGSLLQGPETDPDTVKKLSEAVHSQKPITVEILNYSKLGDPYWVMLSLFPRFDGTGLLKQFMAIQVDVTERIESEKKLAQKQKELEKTNFQINRQRAAAEELVKKEAKARQQLESEIKKSKKLQEQLRKLANEDSLTGIPNRRYFLTRAEAEFQRAKRYRGHLCFIMCDIDYFKQVNDNYGHAVGDEALRKVTQTMIYCLRENVDLIGRMGGEEFCIALPETTINEARVVAERIRKKIEQTPITKNLSVTCSFGISSIEMTESLELVISEADNALYESKTNGRNQVNIRSY